MVYRGKNSLLFHQLFALSPLDGRYGSKTDKLKKYFSEYALIQTRIEIEIKYLIFLSQKKIVRKFKKKEIQILNNIFLNFSFKDALKVREEEKKTRHDIKAVELFLRKKIRNTSLADTIEFLHFGLTSEDINNISYRLMISRGLDEIILPELKKISHLLIMFSEKYKSQPMLARTHGQDAVPTTLGKEFSVFANRLNIEIEKIYKYKFSGKLNGAVGNFNALEFAFPKINWILTSKDFIKSLKLNPNIITTQINTYEDLTSFFQILHRINSILIDFNQDIWRYVSDNWFVQKFKKEEVGSSTMPQKVNPIDFENSEGNLGLANAIIEFFVRKLPVSRLQRDLSDSTVIRSIGSMLGHEIVGLSSIVSGLSRIEVNKKEITRYLNRDWSILTEGVQTYLRSIGVSNSYRLIANLSKGKLIEKKDWIAWVDNLPIEKKHKDYLIKLTPESYIGKAEKLTQEVIDIK